MTSLPCFAEVCSLSVRHGLFIYSGAGEADTRGARRAPACVRGGWRCGRGRPCAAPRATSASTAAAGSSPRWWVAGPECFSCMRLHLHAASSARGFSCMRRLLGRRRRQRRRRALPCGGGSQVRSASAACGFICTRLHLHADSAACGLFCVNRPRLGLTAAASPLSLLFLAEFLGQIFGFSARAAPRVLVEEQKTPPAEKACVLLCGH